MSAPRRHCYTRGSAGRAATVPRHAKGEAEQVPPCPAHFTACDPPRAAPPSPCRPWEQKKNIAKKTAVFARLAEKPRYLHANREYLHPLHPPQHPCHRYRVAARARGERGIAPGVGYSTARLSSRALPHARAASTRRQPRCWAAWWGWGGRGGTVSTTPAKGQHALTSCAIVAIRNHAPKTCNPNYKNRTRLALSLLSTNTEQLRVQTPSVH